MLGIAVPVSVSWMQVSAADRADATNSLRATAMATAIAEHVIADSVSTATGLGMDAFSDPAAYMDTPATGLRARLAGHLDVYAGAGFSYDITIGGLVGPKGVATGDTSLDVCRRVSLTVNFPGARGGTLSMTLEFVVTSPQ